MVSGDVEKKLKFLSFRYKKKIIILNLTLHLQNLYFRIVALRYEKYNQGK